MRILLFCILGILSCLAQPPSPSPINGIRAAFVVGANEDLNVPAITFGIPAIQSATGWSYSQIINNIYLPGVQWWLYRFGVDFTNAVELFFPGSGFFYNGYALASPILADETYRVMASNIPLFNTVIPSRLYLTEYAVTFNQTALDLIEMQLGHKLFYNGTYGNPNNQVIHPRIPINAGFPFRTDNIYYGFYTAVTWASEFLVKDAILTACVPDYIPIPKSKLYRKLAEEAENIDNCPPPCFPPPSPSQVNFTFWMRAYDPSVGYPYYAVPGRSMERQQLCSPQFGPGMSILNVATTVQGFPINGTYPTFLEAAWMFPMNASDAPIPDFFSWNDCGCCQGCVPATSFPPLTNPPGSSSSSTGIEEIRTTSRNNRIDGFGYKPNLKFSKYNK